jgi:hypothetical protein
LILAFLGIGRLGFGGREPIDVLDLPWWYSVDLGRVEICANAVWSDPKDMSLSNSEQLSSPIPSSFSWTLSWCTYFCSL